jgi:protein-tyrosine phosphatase
VVSPVYSVTFVLLSAACAALALATWPVVGWFALVFLHAALSFLLLAVAYAGAGPGVLLKRASGRRPVAAWVLFAPYFLLNAVAFGLYRWRSSQPAFVQVAPNLYFGRRLSAAEAATQPWAGVLDLAAEFAESRPLRELAGYRSLPVLDATAPSEEQLRSAVAWITAAVATGPVYVHCALGHGRSACVVIAYLLAAGEVDTVAAGVKRLRALRPGVGLNASQRRRLAALA